MTCVSIGEPRVLLVSAVSGKEAECLMNNDALIADYLHACHVVGVPERSARDPAGTKNKAIAR